MTPQIEASLVKEYIPLVRKMVRFLTLKKPPTLTTDDMFQDGLIGLVKAIRNNDDREGNTFETYAALRIKGEIIEGFRRYSFIPKNAYRKAKKTIANVDTNGSIEHTYAEMTLLAAYQEPLDIVDLYDDRSLADNGNNPERRAVTLNFLETTWTKLAKISERDRFIFIASVVLEIDSLEIMKRFKVTSSRLSQIVKQTRQTLNDATKYSLHYS